MPDPSPQFEHETLEADIKRLAEEIKRHREAPETKNLPEQELLKHAIRSLPRVEKPPAPVPSAQPSSPLPAYAQDASDETKLEIEYLLDFAFHHGIRRALAEARRAPDFVQDALHDALAGRLYPELQKRGILK